LEWEVEDEDVACRLLALVGLDSIRLELDVGSIDSFLGDLRFAFEGGGVLSRSAIFKRAKEVCGWVVVKDKHKRVHSTLQ